MRVLPALAIVLASIALLRALLAAKGFVPRSGPRSLRVVDALGLGGKQRVVVVEVEGERLLLGAGEGSVTLLRELGPAPEPAPEAASSPAWMDRPWRRRMARALPVVRGVVRRTAPALVGVSTLALASVASAEPEAARTLGDLANALGGATEPEGIASTLQVVALMTLISVAPSILLMATCFTRVVIVLAFLRQAIGVQHLPPNQILIGLAMFVTFFVMSPVINRVQTESIAPYMEQEIGGEVALARAVTPVREFVVQYTREDDLALFASFHGEPAVEDVASIPMATLLPSFLLSELRTAFEIGFMLYLPFLVIDLVIASLLISMGMIVLPPIVISLPFKLMLFVLLDGWNLVIGSLLTGLGGGLE